MTTRILPAVGDADAARAVTTLLSQLPDAEPAAPVDRLHAAARHSRPRSPGESIDELPEVVARARAASARCPPWNSIREVALRFPAVGVVLLTADASPGLSPPPWTPAPAASSDCRCATTNWPPGSRPPPQWSAGVRRHLGAGAGRARRRRRHRRHGHRREGRSRHHRHRRPTRPRRPRVGTQHRPGRPGPAVRRHRLLPRRPVPPLDRRPRRHRRHLPPRPRTTPCTPTTPASPCCSPPARANAARRSPTAPPARSSAPCASRYEVVVVDCGTQLTGANAAAVEMADTAAAGHHARRGRGPGAPSAWSGCGTGSRSARPRRRSRVVNRHTRSTEIQPSLIETHHRHQAAAAPRSPPPSRNSRRASTPAASTTSTAAARSSRRLWALAAELGLVKSPTTRSPRARLRGGDRARSASGDAASWRAGMRRRGDGAVARRDDGQVTVEFLGMTPLILLTLILVWQFVLRRLHFTLAGNAADEAARAATAVPEADAAGGAARKRPDKLPGAWRRAEVAVRRPRAAMVDATVDPPGPGPLPRRRSTSRSTVARPRRGRRRKADRTDDGRGRRRTTGGRHGGREARRDRGQVALEYLGLPARPAPRRRWPGVQLGLVAYAAQQAGTAARAAARTAACDGRRRGAAGRRARTRSATG